MPSSLDSLVRCHNIDREHILPFKLVCLSLETVMLVLYLTVAVGGFFLYGGEVKPNVLENLPSTVLKTLIGVLMAFHVVAAMLIVINPVNLVFEQTIGVGTGSG